MEKVPDDVSAEEWVVGGLEEAIEQQELSEDVDQVEELDDAVEDGQEGAVHFAQSEALHEVDRLALGAEVALVAQGVVHVARQHLHRSQAVQGLQILLTTSQL